MIMRTKTIPLSGFAYEVLQHYIKSRLFVNQSVTTDVGSLYKEYIDFVYLIPEIKGNLEIFEEFKQTVEKTPRPGLVSKRQFGAALELVLKVDHPTISREKTYTTLIKGVAIKSPVDWKSLHKKGVTSQETEEND
jgi:hypothetical protein